MPDSINPPSKLPLRTAAVLMGLTLLGFLGNYFPISLFFGADFLFGSIFVLLILYRFGLAAGLAAGLIIHGYTWFLWSHPYGFLTFMSETLFVGVMLSRGRQNLVLLDALFWLVLGMPLAMLFMGGVLHMGATTTAFITLKQGINGVFNALLASLIVHHLGVAQAYATPAPHPPRKLQDTLFTLLASLVLIPALVIMMLESDREVKRMQDRVLEEMDNQTSDLQGDLYFWYQKNFQAIKLLAALANGSLAGDSTRLPRDTEILQKAFPDFHGMWVTDSGGTAVAFFPTMNERGENIVNPNFADRPYFKKLKATQQPVMSEVFVGRGAVFTPLVTLSTPIVVEGRFQGCAFGGLNLSHIQQLLRANLHNRNLSATLLDLKGQVIASTLREWQPMQVWDRHPPGRTKPLTDTVRHWLPADPGLTSMARWKQSYYIKEVQVHAEIPWRLILEFPVAPLQGQLYAFYVHKLAVMGLLTGLALLASLLFSRRLARPLATLAEVSTGLPAKLMEHREISWPQSAIAEVDSLIGNIQSMSLALEQNFTDLKTRSAELARANADLQAEMQERLKAREALSESEANYRNLVEQIPAVTYIATFNEGGAVTVYISPQIESIMEITPEEFCAIPHFWEKSLHPEDRKRFLAEQVRCLETGQTFEMEYRVMTPSGRVVWVHDQNSLVSDQNGRAQCLQGVLNDITARKQAETEKVELEEQLRQAQKMEAIGTLAGGIAHDFNNILGVIFGCVELAIEERQDPCQLQSHLDETLKAAERARNLVKQILTFGRQSDPRPKPIHLEAIIGEAMNLIRASLPATIEIRQDISNSGLLLGDPIQVQQIIMNLCTNAGHAMRETGGRLTVVLEDVELDEEKLGHLPELAPGPYLRLTVKDTGDGMDRATLKRIFDPYFTTKGPKEETGLGLAVVHGIVQALHGAITVEAAPGQGATFEVYLPRMADPPASGLNPPLPAKVPEERRGLQERILFVDDEELLARVGSRLLQSMGYEVTATTSSVEALNLFCRNPDGFDLVVTDQTMPLMTGDQLAREMLGLRRDLPVILCTGFSDLINEEGAKKLGIREFLLKPIRSPDLAKIVRRVLDEPRP